MAHSAGRVRAIYGFTVVGAVGSGGFTGVFGADSLRGNVGGVPGRFGSGRGVSFLGSPEAPVLLRVFASRFAELPVVSVARRFLTALDFFVFDSV
jgi:hypothetical protein